MYILNAPNLQLWTELYWDLQYQFNVPVTFSRKMIKVDDLRIANKAVVAGPYNIIVMVIVM